MPPTQLCFLTSHPTLLLLPELLASEHAACPLPKYTQPRSVRHRCLSFPDVLRFPAPSPAPHPAPPCSLIGDPWNPRAPVLLVPPEAEVTPHRLTPLLLLVTLLKRHPFCSQWVFCPVLLVSFSPAPRFPGGLFPALPGRLRGASHARPSPPSCLCLLVCGSPADSRTMCGHPSSCSVSCKGINKSIKIQD